MPFEFKLPDIGEGVAEGEVVRWLVKEGETVTEDQPMVEVMTDKATVEIPCPRPGVILQILAAEGTIVPVGQALVVIGESVEGGVEAARPERVEGRAEEAGVVTAAAKPGAKAKATHMGREVVGQEVRRELKEPLPRVKEEGKVLTTPAIRKLARELGVDLARVTGTGPGGRVRKEDVLQFVETQRASRAPAEVKVPAGPPARAGERRIPLRGLRRRIAEKMVKSKQTAPHYTYVDEVDMTALVALREEAKKMAEAGGVRLTYLPFIMKGLIPALKQFPLLNASLDDEKGEIVLKDYYHLGIAIATDEGLVVIVVKDVDRKGLLEIARELETLSQKARQGKLALEDVQGSTFTITSLGPLGGVLATPIINYPEVAILGVHEIKQRPVVRDGQIVIREMMNLSLSFDHRVVDGAVGAQFTQELIRLLENPHRLLVQELLETG